MKRLIYISLLLILGGNFSACEDIVQVDVQQKQKKIVVDAFIDNRHQTQTIRLT